MRQLPLFAASLLLFSCATTRKAETFATSPGNVASYKLIFQDNFNVKGGFDTSKWSFSPRGNVAWNKYLTQQQDYAFVDGSNLVLRMDNIQIAGDPMPYHSGGIQTKGKFSFRYGKVEVRAKFDRGRGAWPAIWMMPEKDTFGGWPASGEIDIMEHVNTESVVHQTVHNAAVTNAAGGSTVSKSVAYKPDDYNVYGLVWTNDRLVFYVNEVLTHMYHKPTNASAKEWPFDQPFYIILNQSGGAGWPGPITDTDLPFTMQVDWVNVYAENE
ncbi:glycoside hydrolase family 16 protein [Flavisolibacter sp. BT320]|nr:glycoside hydrolase family 16 protein [Flavisolibacter longurius]